MRVGARYRRQGEEFVAKGNEERGGDNRGEGMHRIVTNETRACRLMRRATPSKTTLPRRHSLASTQQRRPLQASACKAIQPSLITSFPHHKPPYRSRKPTRQQAPGDASSTPPKNANKTTPSPTVPADDAMALCSENRRRTLSIYLFTVYAARAISIDSGRRAVAEMRGNQSGPI